MVLIAAAILFRREIVGVAPGSQAAFAGLGLPVNALVIESVHAQPTFQGGRPVLAVTGEIRNSRAAAAFAPALRISLLDRDGEPVAAKIAHPIDANIPGGAIRHFAIAIVDPPAGVHDLEVTFDPVAKAESHGGSAAPPGRAPPKKLCWRMARPSPCRPGSTRTPFCPILTDAAPVVLLPQDEVARRVDALARDIAPRLDDSAVAVCPADQRPLVRRRPDAGAFTSRPRRRHRCALARFLRRRARQPRPL